MGVVPAEEALHVLALLQQYFQKSFRHKAEHKSRAGSATLKVCYERLDLYKPIHNSDRGLNIWKVGTSSLGGRLGMAVLCCKAVCSLAPS